MPGVEIWMGTVCAKRVGEVGAADAEHVGNVGSTDAERISPRRKNGKAILEM